MAKKSQIEELKETIASYQKENEELIAEIENLQKQVEKGDKYLDQLVAMKSDFENYKKRMKNDAEGNQNVGKFSVIEKIIPILDTFELASKHLTDDANKSAFEMVKRQFEKVLNECGVVEMDLLGKDFDPMLANALANVDNGEEQKGKVVEVYKKGYVYNEKVLRFAEVVVGA